MTGGPQLKTERLNLRRWRDEDRESFAELNADREGTEFLPRPLSRAESDALMDRIESHFDDRGFGLWAVATDAAPLIGFLGLSVPQFEAHFTPCVEIGWRLARAHLLYRIRRR
jgi:ribosomal-protein-alanine N-acetyltransferase